MTDTSKRCKECGCECTRCAPLTVFKDVFKARWSTDYWVPGNPTYDFYNKTQK